MRKLYVLFLVIVAGVARPDVAQAKGPPHVNKPVASAPTQIVPSLKPIIASYDIYVGGVHFLTADILFQEEAGKYHSKVKAQTYGFWYKTLPWNIAIDAQGTIQGDQLVPAVYDKLEIRPKKGPKDEKISFDPERNPTAIYTPPIGQDDNRIVVTSDEIRGSLDPVTGLLQMLAHVATANDCNVTVPIYDGERLFSITAADAGTDTINEKDYNLYHGPARLCRADFQMVAGGYKTGEKSGFWKMSEQQKGREPFRIWLAPVSPDLPEMAVRLESGSIWGMVVMHLAAWRYASEDDLKP